MTPRPQHPSLASLLGNVDTGRFLREVYGRHPLHIPAVDPHRFDSLMSWDELERVLNMTGYWDDSRLRLVADGRRLAPEQYCFPRSGADSEPRSWRPQPERVKAWWSATDSGKLTLTVRYGSRLLEFAKGKAAVEVAAQQQLVPTLKVICDAVAAGELDAQLELAAARLKAGFKR